MLKPDRVSTRLIGCVAIATMVGGTAVGAEAATKKKKHKPIVRVQKIAYQGGCGIDLAVAAATPGSCVLGGSYTLALKPGEKFISVSVVDAVSPDVPGVLWLGTGVGAANQTFCSTIKNFPATGTQPQLDLFDGPDSACTGSAFTGTITVTYSSNPLK
jgi:hypothetical protein